MIEKILGVDEPLDPSLPVDGTTGYDVLREVGGIFVDPTGAEALTELVDANGFDYANAPEMLRELKIGAATETLSSELARLCRSIVTTVGADHPQLPDAVAALLTNVGVYRSDYLNLSAVLSTAIAHTVAAQPELAEPLALVSAALASDTGEPGARLQQLCGAMTAKSMEDCYFYRDARLVSLNEVGGEPERFGVSAAEFHRSSAVRGRLWPKSMTTLSTHDTKRGEDVRARIGVLSQVPSLWAQYVEGWLSRTSPPDKATALFLLQNIFGVWPVDGAVGDELRQRLHGYAEKAMREAAVHTTWNDPDEQFESGIHGWIDSVIDGPVGVEMTGLVQHLEPHFRNDSLGQKLFALTGPGVPDVYQGTELWEDSLVDPDNRRPVDYAARRTELEAMRHPKMRVTRAALLARRDRPESFLSGGYTPVPATGPAADHLVAYLRGDDVLAATGRHTVALSESGWGDTSLTLPAGDWTDRISGARFSGTVAATDLFADLPVALLERDHA